MNLGSESETVEFKKSTGEHKEALQAISAMLNKHGGGELYFGVKDNGDVIGQEVPEVPLEAIREALANALCHRDYTTGTSVQVNVFKDFVEIASPGLFPEGDSPEKHLSGDANEFHPRNPLIAEALYKADVIEQYGTGIPRIKEACEAAGVAFRFEQTVTSTVVRFDLPGSREAGKVAPSEARPPVLKDSSAFTETELTAIDIAREGGRVTAKALAGAAGVGRTKASETLKALTERGALIWVGKSVRDPHQYYRPPDEG